MPQTPVLSLSLGEFEAHQEGSASWAVGDRGEDRPRVPDAQPWCHSAAKGRAQGLAMVRLASPPRFSGESGRVKMSRKKMPRPRGKSCSTGWRASGQLGLPTPFTAAGSAKDKPPDPGPASYSTSPRHLDTCRMALAELAPPSGQDRKHSTLAWKVKSRELGPGVLFLGLP